jgi:hypothetical protein
MSGKMYIVVSAQFAAFHLWRDAPAEVAFLRNKHRHLFQVKAWVEVGHDDREKEFFIIQRKLEAYLYDYENFDFEDIGSCEMVARKLAMFHDDCIRVEVFEDGENGAVFVKSNNHDI